MHLFRPLHASKCELMEEPALLPTTDNIAISKSKNVLHSAFQSYSFSHCTLHSRLSPNLIES